MIHCTDLDGLVALRGRGLFLNINKRNTIGIILLTIYSRAERRWAESPQAGKEKEEGESEWIQSSFERRLSDV
jgi:hypothetical protein